jgi:hypothetical protein
VWEGRAENTENAKKREAGPMWLPRAWPMPSSQASPASRARLSPSNDQHSRSEPHPIDAAFDSGNIEVLSIEDTARGLRSVATPIPTFPVVPFPRGGRQDGR